MRACSPSAKNRQSGFTLIELMVVIVILGGLIALVGTDVFSSLFKSQVRTAEVQMKNFSQAIELYRLDKHKLPGTLQDLTTSGGEKGGQGSYMKEIPKDPWDNEYEYRPNGNKDFVIRSYGDDGQPDTDDDIYYPPRKT
jgi:general secretion pathway protein G